MNRNRRNKGRATFGGPDWTRRDLSSRWEPVDRESWMAALRKMLRPRPETQPARLSADVQRGTQVTTTEDQ